MDVSPKTLREVEFREKIRGYHQDDVDEFLERVAAGLEIMQERLRQATERALRAEQRAADGGESDDAMRRTLVLAQRTADAAVQEAKDQAARIVAAAESQALSVRTQAADQARQLVAEGTEHAQMEVRRLDDVRQRLLGEIGALEQFLEGERDRLRDALRAALDRVSDAIPSVTPLPFTPVEVRLPSAEEAFPSLPVQPNVPPPSPSSGPAAGGDPTTDFLADLRTSIHADLPSLAAEQVGERRGQ